MALSNLEALLDHARLHPDNARPHPDYDPTLIRPDPDPTLSQNERFEFLWHIKVQDETIPKTFDDFAETLLMLGTPNYFTHFFALHFQTRTPLLNPTRPNPDQTPIRH